MRKYRRFGELLEQSIKKRASTPDQSIGSVQQRLMELLSISQSTLYDWRNGKYLPQPELIPKMARIFVQEWQFDQKWLKDFLEATEYGPKSAVEMIKHELCGDNNQEHQREDKPKNNIKNRSITWDEHISQWFDHSAQAIYSARVLDVIGLLAICLTGWWLTQPFVAQPFATPQVAFEAASSYGVAVLILPLLVGLLAGTAPQAAFQLSKQTKWRKLWSIYCFNAYAGYYILTIFCLLGAMMAYAFGLWPWPALLQLILLVLPPLLLAYATARYRTAKIIRTQPEKLSHYISVSKLLLTVFAALNLLIPIAFYGTYLMLFELSLTFQQDSLLTTLTIWLPHAWPYLSVGLLTLLGASVAFILAKRDTKPGQTRSGWVLLMISAVLCLSAIILAVVIQAG